MYYTYVCVYTHIYIYIERERDREREREREREILSEVAPFGGALDSEVWDACEALHDKEHRAYTAKLQCSDWWRVPAGEIRMPPAMVQADPPPPHPWQTFPMYTYIYIYIHIYIYIYI